MKSKCFVPVIIYNLQVEYNFLLPVPLMGSVSC